ncbi:hypothetical protein GGX14DRAFT_606120 [Mycena pura]|uniref:F-box domain-containing protein n=1 Tax=Mycena pura TaxID=153505 RepID=A0AAD6UPV5_9AGAR|nr:hypothetical protein GGX14DRAFT_606120 [Mycena pura]
MLNSCPTCEFKSITPTILLHPNKTTHIRDLLRAHAEPPEHLQFTISELSAELTRYDNERTRYDKEIARLRTVLSAVESEHATLVAERAALQAYYDDCQGLSSRPPVRRLPVEILVAIFWKCSKPFPPTVALWADREKHRHAHAPLFAVSQVCARWHDIVMGTASLWSTIDFPEDVWEDLHREKMTALLKIVIERSAGLPLHVVLPPRGIASTKAVDLLVKQSVRWKTAAFTGHSLGIECLSKGRFPLLESLELYVVEHQMAEPPTGGPLFHVAPKLKRLVVSESLLTVARPHLQQLNTLECIGVTLPKVTSALSSMMGLSAGTTCSLALQLAWSGSDRRIPYLTPTLSNVGSLSIKFPRPMSWVPNVTDILANLTLPCLETLRFRSNYYLSPIPWPHAEFLALSSRSSFHTHLRSLKIDDFSIGAAELAECLSALPSLQWLAISDDRRDGVEPVIQNSLLSSLTQNPDVQALLPHLRHLVIRSRLQFDDNVFLSFLLSRVSHRQDDSVSCFSVVVSTLPGCRSLEPSVDARIPLSEFLEKHRKISSPDLRASERRDDASRLKDLHATCPLVFSFSLRRWPTALLSSAWYMVKGEGDQTFEKFASRPVAVPKKEFRKRCKECIPSMLSYQPNGNSNESRESIHVVLPSACWRIKMPKGAYFERCRMFGKAFGVGRVKAPTV